MVAFCLAAINPPDKKIHLGLDLQGGTSFVLRLVKAKGPPWTRIRSTRRWK